MVLDIGLTFTIRPRLQNEARLSTLSHTKRTQVLPDPTALL
jgi:hypothetical protein